MREIVERKEIAEVLNNGKYPVLKINMDKEIFENVLYEGDKVRIDFGSFIEKGRLVYNKESDVMEVLIESTMLVDKLTYEDYMIAVEYGASPILSDGQEVVIVMYSEKKKECKIYLMKAIRGRKFCTIVMHFE